MTIFLILDIKKPQNQSKAMITTKSESVYEATSRIVDQILIIELSKEKLDSHLKMITNRSEVLNKSDVINELMGIIQFKVKEELNKLKSQIKPQSVSIQYPEALETSKIYYTVQKILKDWEYVRSNTEPQTFNLYQKITPLLQFLKQS